MQLSRSGDGARVPSRLRDGLEGIVAKRREFGLIVRGRSPHWIKVKNPDAPATTRVIDG